jgi:hypothetical protein
MSSLAPALTLPIYGALGERAFSKWAVFTGPYPLPA